MSGVFAVVGVWFAAAYLFGYFEIARVAPFWLPPLIPVTATFVFSTIFIGIGPLRRAILALDMSWLVSIGFLRCLSFYLAYLSLKGEIPASFAVPVETGVVLIVVSAALLLIYGQPIETRGRRWLIAWNVAGILQVLSILATVIWHILTGQPPRFFATLPLNLFPTFIVPMLFVGHILIAYRLKPGR